MQIVQILYVLGRTFESLGRIAETPETYHWIGPSYRDVAERLERLSARRVMLAGKRR